MSNDKSREQALKSRVANEREAAGKKRVRFSPWVRQEAVELVAGSGIPRDRFAQEMGIGKTSLQRWVLAALAVTKSARPPSERSKLRRVKIQAATPTAGDAAMLQLVFPCGARVVGLGLADLRQLLGVRA